MKILKNILAIGFLAGLMSSCLSVEYPEGSEQQEKGLLNFYVRVPGDQNEYSPKVKGPYEEGETIYINIPSTEESPLDLSELYVRATLDFNCYVEPALPTHINFTQPYDIYVRNAFGEIQHNKIEIVPTKPKISSKKMWEKTHADMGIGNVIASLAVNDKYVAVLSQDWDSELHFLNKNTGEVIMKKNAPTSLVMDITTDANNHFVANRYNIHGAGFMVYVYDDELNAKEVINFQDGDTNPDENGIKMSVCGDMTKGKAFVYCTATSDQRIFYWEFNDGKRITPENDPHVIRYGWAGVPWKYAPVQRGSTADDAETYIAFCNYKEDDNTELKFGSRFQAFSKNAETVRELDPSNHYYKIVDFEVKDINDSKYLFLLSEGYWPWDAKEIFMYDITNPKNFSLTSESENYGEFQLWKSGAYGGLNYSDGGGNIAVYHQNDEIYVYATIYNHGDDGVPTRVVAYKLKVNN
jgi:hypothetical protein